MSQIFIHQEDLPEDIDFGESVAIDSETMGLRIGHDRLCLLQLSAGNEICHLVQFAPDSTYDAPNLRRLLSNDHIVKLFHFARFDISVIAVHFGILLQNIYCTKIASRLVRTYTDRHGLRELCKELLAVDISKQQQSSDWGRPALSDEQKNYAANDVLYLHRLRKELDIRLKREGREELAQSCFAFLPTRALLDIEGWNDIDIFAHS